MKRLQGNITEAKQYLMSLIGNAPYGILAVDLDGFITIANSKAAEYLQLNEHLTQLIDKPVLPTIKHITELEYKLANCLKSGREDFDVPITCTSTRTLTIKGRVILNGMLITIEDISAVKEAEKSLMDYNRQLEQSNKELEQFAYISSHDLQEPLITVMSFVKMLDEDYRDKLDKTGLEYLGFITQAASRMSVLIKGLLDYSRIGRNRELTEVDCQKLVSDVQDNLRDLIQKTNSQIEIHELPKIHAYETEMRSLFQNLISNGIKYTEKEVTPKIIVSSVQENGGIKFSVQDNGIGIEPDNQERIFSIFQRLHSKDLYEGTGIGLAHCRKIIELHKGEIWVESKPHKGSTFYFTIPNQ